MISIALRHGKLVFIAGLMVLLSEVVNTAAAADISASVPGPEERTPRTIRVGPTRSINTIQAAASIASDGDTVEIEAGDYIGTAAVAVWPQNNLKIYGVGGRPRLVANRALAAEKALWVIAGSNVTVENLAFSGARAAARNGAGIRFERGSLVVRRCVFTDSENGMLVGNEPSMTLEIEDSEFAENGAGDGYSHNLYVGTIARLIVRGSYFHHARGGHLLKTRARENLIQYNRLTDEVSGRASYELEFPFGGLAVVVGNLIQQGATSENSTIISFGAEGYKWLYNELYLAHNTIVNDRSEGIFLKTYSGSGLVKALNNIYVGKGDFDNSSNADMGKIWRVHSNDFAAASKFDFRFRFGAEVIADAIPADLANLLRPSREYTYPVGTRALSETGPLVAGAFQSRGY